MKKLFKGIVIFVLLFQISFATVQDGNINNSLENRVTNFINISDRYRIFQLHMKIYSIIEKLNQEDFSMRKNEQLLLIDNLLVENIQSNIEKNSKDWIRKTLSQIITNKGQIIKDFNIINITKIEKKTYTAVNRFFDKIQVRFSNNWKEEKIVLNVYYNWDIWIYYRPQEDIVIPNFIEQNIDMNISNKKISWTISYNNVVKKQNLIILTSWAGNNDRDFYSSRHRIDFVLSKYLNSLWYATFRYDKTWVEASSWDNYSQLTSENLSSDLDLIINNLQLNKNFSINKIWLIWQSEWWVISSIVANKRKDISFLILLWAPYSSLENLIKDGSINLWIDYLGNDIKSRVKSHINALIDMINSSKSWEELSSSMDQYINTLNAEDKITFNIIKNNLPFGSMNDLSSKWFKNYLVLDIKSYLSKIKIPVLVINGDKDFIIDSTRMWIIEKLIRNNNTKSELKILNNAGHMLENNTTWKNEDYSNQTETIKEDWLIKIKSWLNSLN